MTDDDGAMNNEKDDNEEAGNTVDRKTRDFCEAPFL